MFCKAHRGAPERLAQHAYDRTIEVLRRAVQRARLGERDELGTLRRLANLGPAFCAPHDSPEERTNDPLPK